MGDWVKDKFGQDIWQLGKGQEKDWNTHSICERELGNILQGNEIENEL